MRAAPTNEESQVQVTQDSLTVRSFLSLTIQLGLILGVAVLYRIELERGFAVVASIAFGGFLVHCWVPRRWRIQLFVLLAVVAAAEILKWDTIWLYGLGLVLLGLSHLPTSWWLRVALVLMVAIGLAALRAGWLEMPSVQVVIPVLGAMFMFRLIVYLYDLKTDRTTASTWHRLAYFFMFPNLCFPLFPVIDFKTFITSYYDSPAVEIYRKGVFWILRGVSHLMVYRLVYYYFLPRSDSDIAGVIGVFVFMAMTYALYLRVSGLFHLIAGLLCLFGFNLPATNNHYFLASSFTDLWRRINIYWKDFMMKTVFYPAFLATRRWRMSIRLVVATGTVFFVTWFLHSYQWFWLLGIFPIEGTDIAFWGFLGVALSANSVWEARRGRKRRLGQREFSWRSAFRTSAQTVGLFSAMAAIWTLWDSGSFSDWGYRVLRIRETTPRGWLLFGALLASGIGIATVGQALGARGWGLVRAEQLAWRHASKVIPVTAVALIILWFPAVHERVGGSLESAVILAQSTRLNSIDALRQERGYYETLSRTSSLNRSANEQALQEEEAVPLSDLSISESTTDLRAYVLVPNSTTIFKGSKFTTNRWGLRDRDYENKKPSGTYRIALVGSSHVMGSGVADEETFENLLEDRLNDQLAGRGFDRYEILNFSVGGYGLLQTLYVVERVVPAFEPDVIMYVVHPGEEGRFVQRLQRILSSGISLESEYKYVGAVLTRAKATEHLPDSEFRRRLEPYQDGLLRWAFHRKVTAIRAQRAIPVFIYLPLTDRRFERAELRTLSKIAQDDGALNLIIDDVYDGQILEEIRVAEWDNHPNARGHRLIADRLYQELMNNSQKLKLFPSYASEEDH